MESLWTLRGGGVRHGGRPCIESFSIRSILNDVLLVWIPENLRSGP
jgi:hypothetical protein